MNDIIYIGVTIISFLVHVGVRKILTDRYYGKSYRGYRFGWTNYLSAVLHIAAGEVLADHCMIIQPGG
jgi:hypothetical protein